MKTLSSLFLWKPLLLGSALLLSLASLSPAVLIDFNTAATDLSGNFSKANGAVAVTWNSTEGTVGTGGLKTPNGDSQAAYAYTAESYTLNKGDSITISAFFKTSAAISRSANPNGGLYLASSTTENPFGADTGSDSVIRAFLYNLDGGASSNQTNFRYSTSGGAGNTGTTFAGAGNATFSPIFSNWYKMTLTITKTEVENLWNLSASLENWGSTGAAFVGTIYDVSALGVSNAILYNDSSLYVGFQTLRSGSGLSHIDNFYVSVTAVPEPSSLILGGSLLFAGLLLRRFKTNQ